MIDQSITLDHQSQQMKLIEQQNDFLVQVINSVANEITEETIRDFLMDSSAAFEKENGQIVINQVSFYFQKGEASASLA